MYIYGFTYMNKLGLGLLRNSVQCNKRLQLSQKLINAFIISSTFIISEAHMKCIKKLYRLNEQLTDSILKKLQNG